MGKQRQWVRKVTQKEVEFTSGHDQSRRTLHNPSNFCFSLIGKEKKYFQIELINTNKEES